MSKSHLYGLHDRPPHAISLLVALQHTLAVFGGIVAAPLIIAGGMGLSFADTAYLVSSALFISGLATLIQINRFGSIGSGLLSIQGTSFTFIGPLIAAYFILLNKSDPAIALGTLFGTSALCALTVGLCAQFVEKVKLFITANVTGTTVILIGATLVLTTLNNIVREIDTLKASSGSGALAILLTLCAFSVTFATSMQKHPILRMTSVTLGLLFGFILAYFFGFIEFSKLNELGLLQLPEFARFPLGFDLTTYLALLPIFFISSMESIGDLTATSSLSKISMGSADYWKRIRGGVSGDALNSVIASIFCTFPNTSFSQNNGVIRLTGVSSPFVGRYTAVILMCLGAFPLVGGIFLLVPNSVLYGATILMFMLVIVSGINIVQSQAKVDPWRWWVVGFSILLGWALSLSVGEMSFLPAWAQRLFTFPISNGAIFAIFIEAVRVVVREQRVSVHRS